MDNEIATICYHMMLTIERSISDINANGRFDNDIPSQWVSDRYLYFSLRGVVYFRTVPGIDTPIVFDKPVVSELDALER